MHDMHEANRRHWDASSRSWRELRDRDQGWRKCTQQPALAFAGTALELINEFVGELPGKRVCVIGSGDNYAALALAGQGAIVTSTDISEQQLAIAAERADALGLDIRFVRCDAAGLKPLPDAEYDLVCSTNGFLVWIAELGRVFEAVHRVLKPGGHYVLYDIHPFLRPWKDQMAIEMDKPYFDTGPIVSGEPGQRTYEFHWMLSDILNAMLGAGLDLRRMTERPAKDARFWQDFSYEPGTDESLLYWHKNPRAGLPVWLTLAARKPLV